MPSTLNLNHRDRFYKLIDSPKKPAFEIDSFDGRKPAGVEHYSVFHGGSLVHVSESQLAQDFFYLQYVVGLNWICGSKGSETHHLYIYICAPISYRIPS